MKNILFILLVLSVGIANAQSDKLSLGVLYGVSYFDPIILGGYSINYPDNAPFKDKGYNTSTKGLLVRWKIRYHFFMQISLSYSDKTYATNYYQDYINSSYHYVQEKYQYSLILVPVNLGYKVIDKKYFDIDLMVGLGYNYCKSVFASIITYDTQQMALHHGYYNETSHSDTHLYAYSLGIQASYKIYKSLKVFLNPEFVHYNTHNSFYRKFNEYGLKIGLIVNL
jgi:hypothetical protein